MFPTSFPAPRPNRLRRVTLLAGGIAGAFLLAPSGGLAQDAGDLRDFQLPPSGGATASPQAQGPVDSDGGAPIRPRVIATDAPPPAPTRAQPTAAVPTSSAPRAAATGSAPRAPVLTLPETRAVPAPAPASRPQTTRPAIRETSSGELAPVDAPVPTPSSPGSAPVTDAAAGAAPFPAPTATSAPAPSAEVAADESTTPAWLVALALLAVGALGWLFWRRQSARSDAAAPVIERPITRELGEPEQPAAAPGPALLIKVEPLKLTRSVMNTSLAYRLTVVNRTARTLGDVRIGAELTAAHGARPLEEQIAAPGLVLPEAHRIDRLAPGQTRMVEGRLDLPVASIAPIRQGRAALFVPLLRLVAEGIGMEPLARTVVVGQAPAPGSPRLQPFRLDEPPRSYQPIAQRPLDEAALAV